MIIQQTVTNCCIHYKLQFPITRVVLYFPFYLPADKCTFEQGDQCFLSNVSPAVVVLGMTSDDQLDWTLDQQVSVFIFHHLRRKV